MFDLGCFNTHQVYAWKPDFDRNNFVRWVKKGLLIRLRQGYYTFPEYKSKPDFILFFANRIYRPSYISLHTALSFYGIIPEAVMQITSVTSLKTASFQNEFGEYEYKSVREELMFGYDIKPIANGHSLQLARPEKALLDLLYLYPFYNTEKEMEDLRLDEDFLLDELDLSRLDNYLSKFKSKALPKRVNLLKSTYNL
ncbi:Transcriptional regulator, AbiEi antitoxin, Type IV TA system [Tangfeifania diversioriginum]|uniref:Transcriptional regulator, AbiEi antitoxin, Type IV TA system n=2 Tax=Tangfeifania diversioriginum TaxID=1168035 RepID=A0A1M6HB13_9BACT|nr:Transcriptional regulator, AbiEi antitoxin, Type IV TA system [Tangfeifania diversioriginum]